jgi:hypothetical protein
MLNSDYISTFDQFLAQMKYFNTNLLNSLLRKPISNVDESILALSEDFGAKFNAILDYESKVLIDGCRKNIGHEIEPVDFILKTNMNNFLNCISGFAFYNNVSDFFTSIVATFVEKMTQTLQSMSENVKKSS